MQTLMDILAGINALAAAACFGAFFVTAAIAFKAKQAGFPMTWFVCLASINFALTVFVGGLTVFAFQIRGWI